MAGPSGMKFANTLTEHGTMDTITVHTHTHAHTPVYQGCEPRWVCNIVKRIEGWREGSVIN